MPVKKGSSPRVLRLLREAKRLAVEYYAVTGRPLGVTGEIAEFEACRLLGLQLAPVRQAGYDAVRHSPRGPVRVQIKGRFIGAKASRTGQRLGAIRTAAEWDTVMMVLLDDHFDAAEIWEAKRAAVTKALKKPGSVARNRRGALGVLQFRRIARRVWP